MGSYSRVTILKCLIQDWEAQWVECLLCIKEDLSLNPQNPCKLQAGVIAQVRTLPMAE